LFILLFYCILENNKIVCKNENVNVIFNHSSSPNEKRV
jgi:hypothetical protein